MDINQFNLKLELINYLKFKKITNFTEIQKLTIPLILKNRQVLVEAPTGTGKTLSFLLPILNQLNLQDKKLQAIIFVPTRELGKQIYSVLEEISNFLSFKKMLLVGGEDAQKQGQKIQYNPQIIVATPPRINQLIESNSIDLSKVKYVVVDEADMFLDFGFLNQALSFVENKIKKDVFWFLFSATLPIQLQNFIKKYLNQKEFENLIVTKKEKDVLNYLIKINNNDKNKYLLNLINSDEFNPFISFIFAKSNKEVDEIFDFLKQQGIKKIAKYTSDMTPRERNQIIKLLNNDGVVYLITTDVMARGIDILGVSHIINYSFPTDLTFYKHRVGRTNRNDISGNIYTLYLDSENEIISKLKKQNPYINFEIWKNK